MAERAWGTIREDYSSNGTVREYFSHDQARSRTYRWNEDGLGGISDEKQRLCFALSLWNGCDPILKERAFGLTGNKGNNGEDVKEYYFYSDANHASKSGYLLADEDLMRSDVMTEPDRFRMTTMSTANFNLQV